MHKSFFLFSFFLLSSIGVKAQQVTNNHNSDSTAVANQLNGFIKAFVNLDFDQFQSYFADDVTIFFPPSAMVIGRVDGKENAMRVFKTFFDKVKQVKKTAPYLDIVPQKLKLDFYGDVVLTTFELNDPGGLSRRTIVLRKVNGTFLIVHLHASKIDDAK